MSDGKVSDAPSFPALVQQFFTEYLVSQRAMSPYTVAAYRDAMVLFLHFAHQRLGKAPTALSLQDFAPDLILAFLDHLEQQRDNTVQSRNLRLTALRAFLRADPDVIMIGEMRDEETASIGIEASLTGHLVFSTLHTNSAPETVTRLLDMGLNPLNFSDAFLGVLAQRLVRRLCSCKKETHPSEEEFESIVENYGREYFSATGIEFTKTLNIFHPGSCEKCSGTGYKGRMGIHELMEGTKTVKRLIKHAAPTDELFELAMKEGMTTLKQDGINKAFMGFTDITEVKRVCIL